MNNKRKRIFDNIKRSRSGETVWKDKVNKYFTPGFGDPGYYLERRAKIVKAANNMVKFKNKYGRRYDYLIDKNGHVVYSYNNMDEIFKGGKLAQLMEEERLKKIEEERKKNEKFYSKNNYDKEPLGNYGIIDRRDFGGIFDSRAYDNIPDEQILKRLIRQGGVIRPEFGTHFGFIQKNWFNKDSSYKNQKYWDNVNLYKYEREKKIWSKYKNYWDFSNRKARAKELRNIALQREREKIARENKRFALDNKRRALVNRINNEINKARNSGDNEKFKYWSRRRAFYKDIKGMNQYDVWEKVAKNAKFKRDEAERNNNAEDFEFYDHKWKAYNSFDRRNIEYHKQKFAKRIRDEEARRFYARNRGRGVVVPRGFMN